MRARGCVPPVHGACQASPGWPLRLPRVVRGRGKGAVCSYRPGLCQLSGAGGIVVEWLHATPLHLAVPCGVPSARLPGRPLQLPSVRVDMAPTPCLAYDTHLCAMQECSGCSGWALLSTQPTVLSSAQAEGGRVHKPSPSHHPTRIASFHTTQMGSQHAPPQMRNTSEVALQREVLELRDEARRAEERASRALKAKVGGFTGQRSDCPGVSASRAEGRAS